MLTTQAVHVLAGFHTVTVDWSVGPMIFLLKINFNIVT